MVFAGGSGIIPLVFFWVMGNSFGDMATATPAKIAEVTATMGLNITFIAIGAAVAGFMSSFCFGLASQRISNKIRQAYFDQVTRQEIGFFDIKVRLYVNHLTFLESGCADTHSFRRCCKSN
jgi:ATP-binding cassette subfamily B (MDR/TAP) protein 1